MGFDYMQVTCAVVKRQLNLRYDSLCCALESGVTEGALKILEGVKHMLDIMPQKPYDYDDMREYGTAYYKKFLGRMLDGGVEPDEEFFTLRGEPIKL